MEFAICVPILLIFLLNMIQKKKFIIALCNQTMPKELRTEYGLLGGVIEFGNSIYFVKAVGKNNLIKANKSNFNEFIYSISLK